MYLLNIKANDAIINPIINTPAIVIINIRYVLW